MANRYRSIELNWDRRKADKSDQENMAAWDTSTPGYPYRPDVDMGPHIPDSCPNKAKVGLVFVAARFHKAW